MRHQFGCGLMIAILIVAGPAVAAIVEMVLRLAR
jgi:hypothetical protein